MITIALEVSTVVLGNSLPNGINKNPLPANIAFYDTISPQAQLAQPSSEESTYAGLLYTPTLGSDCEEKTATIARNLTLEDIPLPIGVIAFAPSSNCQGNYIFQATQDGARAIVLYPTNNSTVAVISPDSITSDASIPIYFASWTDAAPIAEAMNQYNTDLLNVPFGQNLSGTYATSDYVRLVLKVDRSGASTHSLPDLWIFLLIVLGLLCLIVATTSVAMHTHQYIARRDLRRRIALGEIDLEGLGIKRLTVPKSHIESLPERVWDSGLEKSAEPNHNSRHPMTTFDQTNCAICLDDFEPKVTLVRELPCHHIYHPGCIDNFLITRSSLCPLCKKSVLPKGYIPPDTLLTNATVMRERRLRRRATRGNAINTAADVPTDIEMQQSGSVSQAASPVLQANTTNLAPDNDEEAMVYQRMSVLRRIRFAFFPAQST